MPQSKHTMQAQQLVHKVYWGRGEGKAMSEWGHERVRQEDKDRQRPGKRSKRPTGKARETRKEQKARERAVPGEHFEGTHMSHSWL